MDTIRPLHTFHIPVMGTGYTIDSPIKVAHMGINSVISIIDHRLTERMREYYSRRSGMPYQEISESDSDCRAKRITAYLNLVKKLVDRNIERVRNSTLEAGSEIWKYFEMLNFEHPLKSEFNYVIHLTGKKREEEEQKLRERIQAGSIDVNIMTKLDGSSKSPDGEILSNEYNDAHAALRGFAKSDLSSSIVFSAGLNPRLYNYLTEFDDFFPDTEGNIRKKVILKVSDYRSALIQGKFLAKKGIWVSEFRIESGLNCGGHAFATDGLLLGPILAEFRNNRSLLKQTLFEIWKEALESYGKEVPLLPPTQKLSVQGGVGTTYEQQFLIDQYQVDSVGWGSPFLMVPEAVSIDAETMRILIDAREEDYYLSNASPLGIRFNTVKGNSADEERLERISFGKPGAPCVKKHLATNTEFTEEPICTASLKYQRLKIDRLSDEELSIEEIDKEVQKVTEKLCLCVGLANSNYSEKGIPIPKGTQGSAICPGPNTFYFKEKVSLKEMVNHIYGRTNIIKSESRPNMFMKELSMYIQYLQELIEEYHYSKDPKQKGYITKFTVNLMEGIQYYKELMHTSAEFFPGSKNKYIQYLEEASNRLNHLEFAHN